ncbi:MAG: MFS transporter [Planctomycetota bacterium]
MNRTLLRQIAWVLYDAANSGFGLIVLGPVFVSAFTDAMLPQQPGWPQGEADRIARGLEAFGIMLPGSGVVALLAAIVAAIVVLCAPVLGALADARGWQRRLFVGFGVTGGLVGLCLALLGEQSWLAGAVIYVVGFVCFGLANQFYNAYLPQLAPPDKQGLLSGIGFAVGYIGGAGGMLLAVLYLPKPYSWAFGGVWWLVLATPAYLLMPSVPATRDCGKKSIIADGFGRVWETFHEVRKYRVLFVFLAAFLLYSNGTETIINLSPAFGSDVIGMSEGELVRMFLIVQLVAFLGALGAGFISDRVGNKPVIVTTLVVWCVGSSLMFFITTPMQFTAMACVIGVVLGGVQSSSRALMAQLAPEEIRNEAFGLYAIGSKAVSVFGPLLYVVLSAALGARFGVFAVLPFLLAGLLILLTVREPKSA